jgi:hypothetical protein
MSTVQQLLADLEGAIREEYDKRIFALRAEADELEAERDGKLAQICAFGGGNGNGAHAPEPALAAPVAASAPRQRPQMPTDYGGQLGAVRDAISRRTGRFSSWDLRDELRAAFPEFPAHLVSAALRAMADRGEIKLVERGDRNAKPAIYERTGSDARPPSKAAPGKRSDREAARQPGSTSSA